MTYPRTSRYYGIEQVTGPGDVRSLRRRLIKNLDGVPTLTWHTVTEKDRPDLLSFTFLGDAEQWWRIADANPVLDPRELTAEPGTPVRITLPQVGGERG